jgi:predicted nucleic acid-binding protein
VPNLIIAATAELAGLTILHYDEDFDLIASIPTEWLNSSRIGRMKPCRGMPA